MSNIAVVSSGIKTTVKRYSQHGIREEKDIDVLYEASPGEFAWWALEVAIPNLDRKNIESLRLWGTVAGESLDIGYRIKIVEALRKKGLIKINKESIRAGSVMET